MRLPVEIEEMMLDMERVHRNRMAEAAKADPVKHKKTLVWGDAPLRWLYYNGGVDRRGIRRRFCYTTTRNAAGYFLSFVEVWDTKKGRGERKEFGASRTRKRMQERALRMSKAYRNRNVGRKV